MKKLINLTMFDLLKGVAMLCVLFGHSVVYENGSLGDFWYGKVLHSLLMPAFFMVSGYWLKKKPIKTGIKNSFDYLIKPYLLVIAIIIFIGFVHRALLGNIQEWVDVFLIPSVLVSTKSGSRLGPLWFVVALFWAWCLFYLVVRIKEEKWQMAVAVLSAALGGILMPLQLPFQIAQGLVAFFFVYCGYLLKKKKWLEAKLHPLWCVPMLLVWGATVWFGSMDLYSYDVKYGIVSVVGSLFGAFWLIKLFLYVNLLEWRVLDGIRWIGRYSMWFLCIHAVENAVVPWKILFRFVTPGSAAGVLLLMCLRLLFIVVVCIVLRKIQEMRKGESIC
ncbi:MAG: acyltransferase [Lachnospiraceae bacterium]|nr:acyltransferase [Lachnospiraceae bacterium]